MSIALATTSDSTISILIWSGILIVVVIVLFFVVNTIRKAMLADEPGDAGPSFTLDDLRRMHAAGQISDEEFAKARSRIVRMVRGSADDAAPIDDESADNAGENDSERP